jgi:hypothetical protein
MIKLLNIPRPDLVAWFKHGGAEQFALFPARSTEGCDSAVQIVANFLCRHLAELDC